jgi:hypothetical protein
LVLNQGFKEGWEEMCLSSTGRAEKETNTRKEEKGEELVNNKGKGRGDTKQH